VLWIEREDRRDFFANALGASRKLAHQCAKEILVDPQLWPSLVDDFDLRLEIGSRAPLFAAHRDPFATKRPGDFTCDADVRLQTRVHDVDDVIVPNESILVAGPQCGVNVDEECVLFVREFAQDRVETSGGTEGNTIEIAGVSVILAGAIETAELTPATGDSIMK